MRNNNKGKFTSTLLKNKILKKPVYHAVNYLLQIQYVDYRWNSDAKAFARNRRFANYGYIFCNFLILLTSSLIPFQHRKICCSLPFSNCSPSSSTSSISLFLFFFLFLFVCFLSVFPYFKTKKCHLSPSFLSHWKI